MSAAPRDKSQMALSLLICHTAISIPLTIQSNSSLSTLIDNLYSSDVGLQCLLKPGTGSNSSNTSSSSSSSSSSSYSSSSASTKASAASQQIRLFYLGRELKTKHKTLSSLGIMQGPMKDVGIIHVFVPIGGRRKTSDGVGFKEKEKVVEILDIDNDTSSGERKRKAEVKKPVVKADTKEEAICLDDDSDDDMEAKASRNKMERTRELQSASGSGSGGKEDVIELD